MGPKTEKRGPIVSRMGRPEQSEPLVNTPCCVKERILELRQRGDIPIGAKIIRAKLLADPRYANYSIPSMRSLSRYLKHLGLTRRYNKRQPFETSDLSKATFAHDRWQLDAKGGIKLDPLGFMAMINIKDEFSRVDCIAYPTLRRHLRGTPCREDYQHALRLAFVNFGLPHQIQTDHESTFFENKGNSAFPTVFHMWLKALGIELVFSRFKRPTDQGIIERTHQIVNNLIQRQGQYKTWHQLFKACELERKFMNYYLPLPGEAELTPLIKRPHAKHSGRFYTPVQEAQLLELNRIYDMLDGAKWYRAVSKSRTFHLGGHPYYVKMAKQQKEVCITFCLKDKMLHITNSKGELIEKQQVKGINKEILMGKFRSLKADVQLELPFDPCQPNLARLYGTTLA